MKYLSIFTKSFFAILLGVLFLIPASSQAEYDIYVKQTVNHYCAGQSVFFEYGCTEYMMARLFGGKQPRQAKNKCVNICDTFAHPTAYQKDRELCKSGCRFMMENER